MPRDPAELRFAFYDKDAVTQAFSQNSGCAEASRTSSENGNPWSKDLCAHSSLSFRSASKMERTSAPQ